MFRQLTAAVIAASVIALPIAVEAKGGKGGGSRQSYGGGKHTNSHGGHYQGGQGRSHKGGDYRNGKTGDQYGKHKG